MPINLSSYKTIASKVYDSPATVTVASAPTTDIGAAASNIVDVTGTASITSFGTKAAGAMRWVRFTDDGALITHDGVAIILPGAASINTTAGDTAVFVSLGSGNWRCISYQLADGSNPSFIQDQAQVVAMLFNNSNFN